MRNLILLADQHHRDRWMRSVGRHKNGIQPVRVRTRVAGALHKSMINLGRVSRFHTACSACQVSINVNAANNVICYNNTRCAVIYRNLTEIINLGDNIAEEKINRTKMSRKL